MHKISDTPNLEFVRECVLLARRWRSKVDERMKSTGMTLARATVLYWVDELPEGTSQRELAALVGIEGPTLVRLLHALEAQGLIERVPSTTDRRAEAIRLTDKGRPLLQQVTDLSDDMGREYLGKLDQRRVASATKLAREARAALE